MPCIARPCSWVRRTKVPQGLEVRVSTRATSGIWTAISSTFFIWVRYLHPKLQVERNSALGVAPAQLRQALQLSHQGRRRLGAFPHGSAQGRGALLGGVMDRSLNLQGPSGIGELGGQIAVGAGGPLRESQIVTSQIGAVGDLRRRNIRHLNVPGGGERLGETRAQGVEMDVGDATPSRRYSKAVQIFD